MSRADCSVQCFENGFNCAQAVFSTYCNKFGLDEETALKIAGGFGAGMGYIGETCGAVSGAFMLIGLKYGKSKSEDNAAKEKTYSLVREFTKRFKTIHGSVQCKDLLRCDISTPEGVKTAEENHVFTTICPELVRDSCKTIEELLDLSDDQHR